LIADDEPALARVYANTLRSVGFEVELVADGAQALELLLERDYTALISDVRMPGLNGIELLREVRQRRPNVPVILVTGQRDAEIYDAARDLGSLRYLLKPVRMEQLIRAVHNAKDLHSAWVRQASHRTTPV
jgi:DNA-binding NtrC family response regulator